MNGTTTHDAFPLTPPRTALALAGAARLLARTAALLRRAANARRRAAALDPHVGERTALGELPSHVLEDIGASTTLLALAAEDRHRRVAERVLAGLY